MKITKRQLQGIIAESTKKALNELDWKTYDSAMRKAAKNGEWNRVGKFGDASKAAFNRDFAYQKHPEDYGYERIYTPYQTDFNRDLEPIDDKTISNQGYYIDNVYLMHPNERGHVLDRIDMTYRRKPNGKIEKDSPLRQNKNNYDDYDWYLTNGYEDGADINSAMAAAKKGENETLNYLKGNYKYKKGEGWKLNESKLRKIVNESMRKVLSEAGHLYWTDDEGIGHSNSKDLYRGVYGAIFVSHGEWSDPEILYKKHSINYWDAEEGLWREYKEYCQDEGIEPTDEGFEDYANNIADVAGLLDDCVWAQDGCR